MARLQLFANHYKEEDSRVYEELAKWLAGKGVDLVLARCDSEDEIITKAMDADIYLAYKRKVTRKIIASLPRLKLLMASGSGYDHIDVQAATDHGVIVTNSAEHNAEDVAEHALCLILNCVRGIPVLQHVVHQGHWPRGRVASPVHRLSHQTLGLIGFGRIARILARKAKACGCLILACDPYIQPDVFREHGIDQVSLDELLVRSDVLSLHLRVTDQTRHLLGENELLKMKPTAWIVNVSRGDVIDEAALIRALREGRLAGAALDVLEIEPPRSDNPLLSMKNVLITGHVAGSTVEAVEDWSAEIRRIVDSFLDGRWPSTVINHEVAPRIALR